MFKNVQHITGSLLGSLEAGKCAVIRRGGDFIRTSLVVEVFTHTPEYACFETIHAIYKVSLATLPSEAALPGLLRMVA